jgi:hypothetical protein
LFQSQKIWKLKAGELPASELSLFMSESHIGAFHRRGEAERQ